MTATDRSLLEHRSDQTEVGDRVDRATDHPGEDHQDAEQGQHERRVDPRLAPHGHHRRTGERHEHAENRQQHEQSPRNERLERVAEVVEGEVVARPVDNECGLLCGRGKGGDADEGDAGEHDAADRDPLAEGDREQLGEEADCGDGHHVHGRMVNAKWMIPPIAVLPPKPALP